MTSKARQLANIADSDGGLNVDSGTLFVDASTNRVGIGTSSPGAKLEINGDALTSWAASSTKFIGSKFSTTYDLGMYMDTDNRKLTLSAKAVDASGTIAFETGVTPTERMRIDSSGNVGIGVTPEAWNIYKAIQVGSTGYIASPSSGIYTQIGNNAYYDGAWKYTTTANAINLSFSTGGSLFFQQAASGTADTALTWTDSMTLDSSGNLLVGTTTAGGDDGITLYGNIANQGYMQISTATGSNADLVYFGNNGSTVGKIAVTSSSTSYNTSSDYRLKENVVDMTGAIDRVKALPVRRFNFIADSDTTVDGFIAHEAQAVVPEAVTGAKDAVDDEGNPVYQGIDQSKLVPLLTGALKEAIAKIEALETTQASLIARIEALEANP